MLEVARWFMSTLWGSYASRCTNGLNEKKPYNPVLGEQFFCKLGDVDCICEQGTYYGTIFFFFYPRMAIVCPSSIGVGV